MAVKKRLTRKFELRVIENAAFAVRGRAKVLQLYGLTDYDKYCAKTRPFKSFVTPDYG